MSGKLHAAIQKLNGNTMIGNGSYKASFIFAITLHMVLVLFLLIKITTSKSAAALVSSNDFINATAINEHDFDNQMNKMLANQKALPKQEKIPAAAKQQPVLLPEPVVAVKKPEAKKDQLQSILQKNLLAEQAKEIAELKKERQKLKKTAAKLEQQEMQKMLQEQVAAEQKQLASAQAGAEAEAAAAHGRRLQGEVDKYKALIIQAISSQWIVPDGVDAGSICRLLINVAPGGVVLNVQLVSSSGNIALDRSAQAAVLKASPLPVPEDAGLFNSVRTINLTVRPEGIVGN